MSDAVDVAIVGAGPYGLSVAAHLRGSGRASASSAADAPVAGEDAAGHVPEVAGLRLEPVRSGRTFTLPAFCRASGRPYADYGLPVPLDTFVAYGQWFQTQRARRLEETLVTGLVAPGGHSS